MTAEPECSAVDLCPCDRFLLLASDGVWGVLSCQAAVDIVAGCATAEQGAQKVCRPPPTASVPSNAFLLRFRDDVRAI